MNIDLTTAKFKSAASKLLQSSSSTFVPNSTNSVSNWRTSCSASCCYCRSEICRKLEAVNGERKKKVTRFLPNHLFDSAPSQFEVEDAVAALGSFMKSTSSCETLQRILGGQDSRILQSPGFKRIFDAFHMLQTDPSVKRLVLSLSSDKAVWDAIMKNAEFQKIKELSYSAESARPHQISHEEPDSLASLVGFVSDDATDESGRPGNYQEEQDLGIRILSLILDIVKAKVMELIESFQSLMKDLFQQIKRKRITTGINDAEEKVKSSMLLSIVILMIVVVARAQKLA